MRNKSRLLEKLGLGMGVTGLLMGVGFSINGLCIDKPESYDQLNQINSNMAYIREAKTNLDKSSYQFCQEDFDLALKNLYNKKTKIENTSEFREYENQKGKNSKRYFFSIMGVVSGAYLFAIKYHKRREEEDKENEKKD